MESLLNGAAFSGVAQHERNMIKEHPASLFFFIFLCMQAKVYSNRWI